MRFCRARFLISVVLCLSAAAACAAACAAADADPCQQGRQFYLDHDYLAAEPLLRRCLQDEGESLQALLPLTMMMVVQQRVEDGLDFGARALILGPDNPNVRYWYGRALLLAGKPEQAQQQWEQGMLLDAGHVGILEAMTRLNLQQGRFAVAYNLLRQMRLQGVAEPWLFRLQADLAKQRGQWEQAADHWREVAEREGATEESQLMQGELMILAGKAEVAVDIFRRALDRQRTAAMCGGLGEAWFALDQLDSAVVALSEAVALAPQDSRHRFNLANVLELLGRFEEAGPQFRHYLELRPDDPVGRFHYAVHLRRRQAGDEAIAQLEEAVRLDPAYVQARVVLAQIYEETGRIEKALAEVSTLARLDPASAEPLAAWHDRLGREQAEAARELAAGRIYLLHIVTADQEDSEAVLEGLATGAEFHELAVRFSAGPTAVRGGDIGWIRPADLMPELREAVAALLPGMTSPPLTAGGQLHVFKRVR